MSGLLAESLLLQDILVYIIVIQTIFRYFGEPTSWNLKGVVSCNKRWIIAPNLIFMAKASLQEQITVRRAVTFISLLYKLISN